MRRVSKYENFQKLLFQWMYDQSERAIPISKIRICCHSLLKQYFPEEDTKHALYYFLFPLLRKGNIEFCGKGAYAVASPAIIMNGKRGIALNLSSHLQEKFEQVFQYSNLLDIELLIFEANWEDVFQFGEIFEIPTQKIDHHAIIDVIPDLKNVIESLEEKMMVDINILTWFHRGKKLKTSKTAGLYAAGIEVFSKRYFRNDLGKWFQVPSLEEHPDINNICHCYEHILNGEKMNIKYNEANGTLWIEEMFFPIIVERLLRLHVYLNGGKVVESESGIILLGLSRRVFNQLNRIFHYKLELV